MENSKEKLIQQLKEREREIEEEKRRRDTYNRKILEELPIEVNKIMDRFSAVCEKPLILEPGEEKVRLEWAYNRETIGEISVKKIEVKFSNRFLRLNLDPAIGYVGATAKINVATNNLNAERKWPIHKGGIFITIGYNEGEENAAHYLDKNYEFRTFIDEVIVEILKAVFLEP